MADKIPLMMLPSFMATSSLWRHQLDALSDIADMKAIDLAPFDSIEGMATAVLEAAPEHFALAGLSLGGYAAFEVMRRSPERVTKLALVSTTARADTPERLEGRKAQMEMVRSGRFAEAIEPFLTMIQNPDHPLAPEVLETVRKMCHKVGPEGLLNQQTAMMNRTDRRADLPAISCPTIVICGRQDQPTPLEHSEEMAAAIPGARLVVIENCGHFSAIERPEEVTAAFREWLLQKSITAPPPPHSAATASSAPAGRSAARRTLQLRLDDLTVERPWARRQLRQQHQRSRFIRCRPSLDPPRSRARPDAPGALALCRDPEHAPPRHTAATVSSARACHSAAIR